jgi:hypothetical protein
MNRRTLLWGLATLVYAVFCLWYTDLRGQIAAFSRQLEAAGAPPATLASLRGFMETDTGRQFLMVNVIDLADDPPDVAGAAPGETAEQLMGRYMEHMFPELLKRACHPAFVGWAVHPAVDLVGIEGAEQWTMAALFRYRSRRALMEIVSNPATLARHEFKIAALDKTIAYPVEAVLYLGDPRLLLGLVLLSGTALVDLAMQRRRR